MHKGITAIQNVNTLRWAMYYGIQVNWNLLWGFPGETAEDYAEQARLLPLVAHLTPPSGAGRIWLERFSPIYQDDQFAKEEMTPEMSYRYTYPDSFNLDRLAYFFEYRLRGLPPNEAYVETAEAVKAWQQLWKGNRQPTLEAWLSPGLVQIEDHRETSSDGHYYSFTGNVANLYAECMDRPQTASRLQLKLGGDIDISEIVGALDELCRARLMMNDGERYLSLAIRANGGHSLPFLKST